MKSFVDVFEETVGSKYLFAYERLLELNSIRNLHLNPLAVKFSTRVDRYYVMVQNDWNSESRGNELNFSDKEVIAAVVVQYLDHMREATEFLEDRIFKYPLAAALWDMERSLKTSEVIYDWQDDADF